MRVMRASVPDLVDMTCILGILPGGKREAASARGLFLSDTS